jgi:hypothetical protein
MVKPNITPNEKVTQILDDLELYLEFCQDHGYKYNEADLYNWKSYAYQQFNKWFQGKPVKDMWIEDAKRASYHRRF